MPQTVYAMCGLAFAGKSSLAAILTRELDAQLISLDAINDEQGLRGGEGMSDRQWEATSAIAMDRLGTLLQQGRSVVVDSLSARPMSTRGPRPWQPFPNHLHGRVVGRNRGATAGQ